MSKTTTCFDVIFQRKQSKRLFLLLGVDTMLRCRLEFTTGRNGLSHSLQLHNKVSWLLLCPLGFTVRSFQTYHPARFHSFTDPKVHPQPRMCEPCVAAVCVTDFCWHTPWRIGIPRKNPALCNLAVARFIKLPQPVALAGNPHALGFLLGERLPHDRNEILQS